MSFDVNKVRADFPYLKEAAGEKGIVYFDNAATTQKPQVLLDSFAKNYQQFNANVHRGTYKLSQMSTELYENARRRVAEFIGANSKKEIIFTRGTTEGMNLIMNSWGRANIKEGDLILVSRMDHHSSFVPWQQLAKEKKAQFEIIELNSMLQIDMNKFMAQLKKKPKLICFPHISNTLGVVNPVKDISVMAKKAGATVVVDGAQSLAFETINIKEDWPLVDFFVTSAHKMWGPTGIGFVWAKEETLNAMPPFHFGGDMIEEVSEKDSTWNKLPWKFEAGTPNYLDAIVWADVIDYIDSLNPKEIHEYEKELTIYFLSKWSVLEGRLKLLGSQRPEKRVPIFSFYSPLICSQDLASYMDQENICLRVGHHCTQPLMKSLGIDGTLRASLSMYNTREEIDCFFKALTEAVDFFEKRLKKKNGAEIQKLSMEEIKDWLQPIIDPEMNFSLVDLGLIYQAEHLADGSVYVAMTLTSPACPMAGQILEEVKSRLLLNSKITKAKVDLVWEPKWNPQEMASEDVKEELGIW